MDNELANEAATADKGEVKAFDADVNERAEAVVAAVGERMEAVSAAVGERAGAVAAAVGEGGRAVANAASSFAASVAGIAGKKEEAPRLNAMGAARSGVDLVLEGGGMRGIFTAGVLDVLQEQGIYGFDTVWGVSAGAINAASYLSRQQGRFMRQVLAFRDDDRFMSIKSFATTGDMAGADFMYHQIQDDIDPYDYETFAARRSRYMVVASNVVFGTPGYLEVAEMPRDVDFVRASASLPVISRMVEVAGGRYLDGGTTDSVPVERAFEEGADTAVVVLTQHRDYVKTGGYELQHLADRRYADFPYYLEALRTRSKRYMEQREHIWELEREGRVVVVSPSEPVTVGSTSGGDGEGLLRLYLDGRRQATEALDAIRSLGA